MKLASAAVFSDEDTRMKLESHVTRRVAKAMKPPHARRLPLLRTSQQRLKTFQVTFLDMRLAELNATVIHEKERGNSICSCGERIEVKEKAGLVPMSESGGMRE